MSAYSVSLLLNLLMVAGGIMTLYGLYFVFIAFVGLKKNKPAPPAPPQTRFAVLVAARNEAPVIGQLVDSLNRQNYPKDLYTVFVAPNNCTDDTRAVALAHGATIFQHKGVVHSKGDVLHQIGEKLLSGGEFDAFCVLDADNLVHPDFLQRMNDAHLAGVQVAQGFRDSKNPADSAVSTCYSICYWMLNRFYNNGRQRLKLSSLVNGSGFMMSVDLLRRLGGWCTTTMTEDYEMTAQCVLLGEKVQYVPQAIIYDEQPLTFLQSWRQRRRWSSGSVQGMEIYLSRLTRQGFKARSWACLDLSLTYMTPMVQLISLLTGLVTFALGLYHILVFKPVPLAFAVGLAALALVAVFIILTWFASFVIRLSRGKNLRGTFKGMAYFALFLLSWLPISVISLFKKTKTWDAIGHSSTASIGDVMNQ